MDLRLGFTCLLILSAVWAVAAREMASAEIFIIGAVIPEISEEQVQEIQVPDEAFKNNQVCTLCEEFTAQALAYLADNKTQVEIVAKLHKSCSRAGSFKQQCITLVDYYAPLFFVEVSVVQPQNFCHKVNLCQEIVTFASQLRKDSCQICQHAISEALDKLKDPDTKMEIIELLLKACNSMENYTRKCKKMVFEYGPLVLTNAEQFLETTDVCTVLHACSTPKAGAGQTSAILKADS